jgi:hypothetical protein
MIGRIVLLSTTQTRPLWGFNGLRDHERRSLDSRPVTNKPSQYFYLFVSEFGL